MTIQLANLGRLQAMVASLLNVNPEDMSYAGATTTDQEKYAPQHIIDAILYIDLEVCRTHQETIGDGRRERYGTMTLITSGQILSHPGRTGIVEIQADEEADPVRGIKVRSIDQIRKYLTNPDSMYTTAIALGRYHVDEEYRIYFVGAFARVFVPNDLRIELPYVVGTARAAGSSTLGSNSVVDGGNIFLIGDEGKRILFPAAFGDFIGYLKYVSSSTMTVWSDAGFTVPVNAVLTIAGAGAYTYGSSIITPTPICQAPVEDEPTIARGAVSMLAKDGMDLSFLQKFATEYQSDLNRIRSLGGPAPSLDMFAKLGG